MSLESVGSSFPPPPPIGNPPPPPIGNPPPVGGDTTTNPTTPVTPTETTLPPPPPPPPGSGSASTTLAMADKFTSVSGYVGAGLGGGMGALKSVGNLKLIGQSFKGVDVPTGIDGESTNLGSGMSSKIKGAGMAAKGLGSSAVAGAKYGAILGGAVSALSNGYQVLTGKKTGGDAVSTFAADTATATISGAAGALAGGGTALLLSGAIGMGSLPVTIAAVGVGLIGSVGAQFLTQKSGLYDSIKTAVKGMFGG